MLARYLVLAVAVSLVSAACGSGPVITKQPQPQPVAPKPVDDAFSQFGGKKVTAGVPFKITSEPVGIASLRAVITMQKASWTVFTSPEGKEEKEYTAFILVQRGGKTVRKRMEPGDSKTILGLKVTVQKIGEQYVEARKNWFPFGLLMVK